MNYKSRYNAFIFESYSFDSESKTALFKYSFDGERHFCESVEFNTVNNNIDLDNVNQLVLDSALQLAFYLTGVSYYKTFPTTKVTFKTSKPDEWQADFLNKIYSEGLSQFYFENNLEKSDMPQINGLGVNKKTAAYSAVGKIVLQSGGKDSLLLACLLEEKSINYTPWYIKYSQAHPSVLDDLKWPLVTVDRYLDKQALEIAKVDGALNGHVPVTYIVLGYALIDAILSGKDSILVAIGAEGSEPHDYIQDIPVNHQWAKTWMAEQLFSKYVQDYISPSIKVGSPLRGFSELKIAELFVKHAWQRFGHSFSSCNRANYEQGRDNTHLRWCSECPKCANSYLLFSPFVEPTELKSIFGKQDLFMKPSLTGTFKGLLGVEGIMKPFECVGETTELRKAYQMARARFGDTEYNLPFDVPESSFDYNKIQPHNNKIEPNLYGL